MTPLYYVAHRLFAAHDRALAAELAHRITQAHGSGSVFLPFCDTDEENLVDRCKGRRLFELDTQRLGRITAMAAFLHGPSLDDGVCMEIGYAAARGIPVIAATTDFQTFGPHPDGRAQMPFPEPLLPVVTSAVVTARRLGTADGPRSSRYAQFLAGNLATVDELLDQTVDALTELLHHGEPFPDIGPSRPAAYLEPSPYGIDDRMGDLAKLLLDAGWEVHTAARFDGDDPLEAARADWHALSRATIAIVDIRGPETPPGAAATIGACVASRRSVYAPAPGGWWTFAHGREPNFRNLMIQYGLTGTFDRPGQLIDMLTA